MKESSMITLRDLTEPNDHPPRSSQATAASGTVRRPTPLIGPRVYGSPTGLAGWAAVTLAVAALLGSPREFAVEAKYPEWITYAPGIAVVLAPCAAYVCGFATGHGVMRLVAGPAKESRLARWPSEAARSGEALDGGRTWAFPDS